ncbi:MAG: YgiT-type zinc finger protein [Candidatus Micrarchaeota archaeon]
MLCPICEKGKMNEKIVDVVRHGIFLGHFKADVCNACNEEIFDSKIAAKIESRMKELGLFGTQKTTVYQIGGNVAVALKAEIAKALGVTKSSKPTIIAQPAEKRIILEF